jgi:hypothetical protein
VGLRFPFRAVLTAAALVAPAVVVPAGGARAADDGMVVVRLETDPAPAGTSWKYSGPSSSYELGDTTQDHTETVAPGAYTVVEQPEQPGAPSTLTAVSCTDPSRDSRGSVATATARIAVAAGETVTCVFVHRALGPRPGAASVTLARRYAPELRLTAGEPYRPLALPDYVRAAALRTGVPPHGVVAQPRPTLFTLPTALGASYLDVRGAEPYWHAATYRAIESRLEAASAEPTVYWHLARQPSTGRIALEYWFLYLYNDFTDRHEADWEGVTVFLADGRPIGASYSQHQGRRWAAWGAAPLDRGPSVYVGRGSHANYPAPGRPRVRVCWSLAGRHCLSTRKTDVATGDGTDLAPAQYDLHELGGAGFTGGYGSGTYVLGIGRTNGRVTDARRRADYSNPFTAIPPLP